MALSENYESYSYYVLTHYSNCGKIEKGNFYRPIQRPKIHYGKIEKGNFYRPIQRPKIHSKIEENSCDLIHADRNKKTVILGPPPIV